MVDLNGDNKADVMSFANGRCIYSISRGKNTAFNNVSVLSGEFVYNHGRESQNSFPRMFGDVNGDGLMDVIGFEGRGIKISLASKDRCTS